MNCNTRGQRRSCRSRRGNTRSLKPRYECLERRYLLAVALGEFGTDDFVISEESLGEDARPAAAYNSIAEEYLVVWRGIAGIDQTGYPPEEYEIFGQRFDTSSGDPLGDNFRISYLGTDGDSAFDVQAPAVAFNSLTNEYFVTWSGSLSGENDFPSNYEIMGQRLDGGGGPLGTAVRISDMGPASDNSFRATDPTVAFNSTQNEYLVAWVGTDDGAGLASSEREIYAQRLTALGAEIGDNDLRISDMGPDGDINHVVNRPAVAYNAVDDEYLVVWSGDDNTAPLVRGEYEVFGQRIAGVGGEIGGNDFRISDLGPDGNVRYDAGRYTTVAYNSADNQYLVVWSGQDGVDELPADENEIFAQVLAADGTEIFTNDFVISDMGGAGDLRSARDPSVAYDGANNRYLVAWSGDESVRFEHEIYVQLLAADGTELAQDDYRISHIGPDGDPPYDAESPVVVADPIGQKFLAAFAGQELIGDQRVFGQQLGYLTDDFGDAPEPFPVTLADDGARHAVVDGFHLGAGIDLDFDGQPSPVANGDDDDGADDEDGVSFDTPLMIGDDATITVTASAAGRLDAWIDFNGDDDWNDASDQIFVSQALVAGDNELTFSVPADASHGYSYARFRFSTAGGLSFGGPAADGEVEDYRVVIDRDWTPLHIDFNANETSSTAAGYVGLLPNDLYTSERGFGWIGSFTPIGLESTSRGGSDPLLSDAQGTALYPLHLVVDVPAGDYVVNVTMDRELFAVEIEAEAEDPFEFHPRGWNDHFSFPVHVDDGQLDLSFSSLYGFVLRAMDIYPAPVATHTLTADGNTFTGSGASAGALVSVQTDVGTILTADADPLYYGTQVRADESGTFQFDVQPAGLSGEVVVASEEVDGAGAGSLDHTILLTPLHIDFNANETSSTAAGYVGLLPNDLYTSERGFGWIGSFTPIGLESTSRGGSDPLLSDAQGTALYPLHLVVDVPAGDYVVNVTMDRELFAVEIEAEAEDPFEFHPRGWNDHFSFPVHVDDGQLDLSFSSLYGFVLRAMDIYPAPVATHTLTADGNTFTGSGASAGALVSVQTDVGTILTADADPLYYGTQVRADESGTFQFDVQPAGLSGEVVVASEEVDGAGAGSLDHTILLTPLHIDFNANETSSTAAGYVGLLPNDLYTSERGFGWIGSFTPIGLESTSRGGSDPLLSDAQGAALYPLHLVVDVPAGDYVVNVTMDRELFAVEIEAEAEDPFEFHPRGWNDHFSFPVHVDDGQLDLSFSSLYGFVLRAMDIYPAPVATHTLTADGNTFTGSGASAGALVSVQTDVGTILTADADPLYYGTQVRADESGTFQFDVQPAGLSGEVVVASEEVDGAGAGSLDHTILLTPLHIDFNANETSSTAAGYVGLLPNDLYTSERGFGWIGSFTPIGLESTSRGGSDPLLSDAQGAALYPLHLVVDVPAGDYVVNVTMDRELFAVEIEAEAEDPFEFHPRGWNDHFSFPVHVDDGQLDLSFSSLYGFVLRAMDIYPAPVATHTLTGPSGGSLFEGTGATPETLVTVRSDVGTITTPDASDLYYGHQVLADGLGRFTVNIDIPDLGEGVTIETEEVTGGGRGSYTFFLPENSLRLDFNSDASPTAAGFLGVPPTTVYSPSLGYGWETAAVSWDLGEPNALLRDMHLGSDNTFLVDVASGNYTIQMTLANPCGEGLVDVYANDAIVFDELVPQPGGFFHARFTANAIDDQIELRLVSDSLSSPWKIATLEVFPATESDTDGVADAIEEGAPHGGDGNQDGIADSMQANVASLPNAMTGDYVTIVAPAGTQLEAVTAVLDPLYSTRPSGYAFPLGFFDFTVTGLAPGGAADVTIFPQTATPLSVVYKHGPTPDDASAHWYPFSYDGTTGAEILSDRIVLHLVDGARGDSDLTVDAVLHDPFGAAMPSSPTPWQNPTNPHDVNNDGNVTALDALLVINQIARLGGSPPYPLPVPPQPPDVPPPFYDVDGNNQLSALDALRVINRIGIVDVGDMEAETATPTQVMLPVDPQSLMTSVSSEDDPDLLTAATDDSASQRNAVSKSQQSIADLQPEAVDRVWTGVALSAPSDAPEDDGGAAVDAVLELELDGPEW